MIAVAVVAAFLTRFAAARLATDGVVCGLEQSVETEFSSASAALTGVSLHVEVGLACLGRARESVRRFRL